MATYVGEGLTIICSAVDPVTGDVIADADSHVDFFAPGKLPAKVTSDRTVDQGPYTMAFNPTITNSDGTVGAYVVEVDTTGWTAGKWTYRVTVTGAFSAWDFGTVKLDA